MLNKNILISLWVKKKKYQGTHNHFHINIINTFNNVVVWQEGSSQQRVSSHIHNYGYSNDNKRILGHVFIREFQNRLGVQIGFGVTS